MRKTTKKPRLRVVKIRRRPQLTKKWLYIGSSLVILAIASWLAFGYKHGPDTKSNNTNTEANMDTKTNPQTIKFIATGDIIAHDALNLRAHQADGSYDYSQFMGAMVPYFSAADIRFCNQSVPSGGAKYGITGYPTFNSPLEIINDMAKLGCNLVNTGTNHSFDKGIEVIKTQLAAWSEQPNILAIAGENRSAEEQQMVRYFTVKGVKFAYVSYTTYSNAKITVPYAVTTYDDDLAAKQIGEARQKADLVIVSMRWGTEYSDNISDAQDTYAHKLANLGADIILGHGPHVIEPVQRLKGLDGRDTLVWFSLGNFLNAQEQIEALTGCIATMNIDVATKKVTDIGCMPIYMHYEWTPAQKASEQLLSRQAFLLVPLETAQELLIRSQNNTTVAAQTARLQAILNRYIPVTMLPAKP